MVFVALAGTVVGVVLARRRRPAEKAAPLEDERTQELRRKLAEARAAAADQDDFEAAGMGAETIVDEPPRAAAPEREEPAKAGPEPEPEQKQEPAPDPPAPPAPKATEPSPPPAAAEPPPQDEFEAMRRRIHEEGRAAAEEMRRSADPPEKP